MRLNRGRVLALITSVVMAMTAGAGLAAPSTVSRSWIDQPLLGAHLLPGSVEITAHTTSQRGVDEVVLLVDGVLDQSVRGDGQRLVTARFEWLPEFEKGYWLTVRGRSGQEWGIRSTTFVIVGNPVAPIDLPTPGPLPTLPAEIVAASAIPVGSNPTVESTATPGSTTAATARPTVTQVATDGPIQTPTPRATPTPTASRATPTPTANRATPTPTPRPTPTPTPRPTPTPTPRPTPTPTPRPTPTPTPRPTPTPCAPRPPSLSSPGNGSEVGDLSPTLTWEYREMPNCDPSGFRVQIATDRQFDQVLATGNVGPDTWQWTTPVLEDCTFYYWHVRAKGSDGSFGDWSDMWPFHVQATRCG